MGLLIGHGQHKETISIDKNRETAEKFADEFMKLKKKEKFNW